MDLLIPTPEGLYCPQGDFYVDPQRAVPRAVITHAHADHARYGSQAYLSSAEGANVLQTRLGANAKIETLQYGQVLRIKDVELSLHPAGHILGSAQVRLAYKGHVWVVSGDYKTEPDRTSTPFEAVPCHTFITESTFGLPIYRWVPQHEVFADINAWWQRNRDEGRSSVIFAYSLGKAQRVLAGLDATIGPIFVHGAVAALNDAYRRSGIALPEAPHLVTDIARADKTGTMVIAPPSSDSGPWLARFKPYRTAFASGWMQVRGRRRFGNYDRGFALSDHADWPGLLQAIHDTGAERVYVTHGFIAPLVRWLSEHGTYAEALPTHYKGDDGVESEQLPEMAQGKLFPSG
jgi:putative mRNA 3-end processing factor